MMAEKKEHAYTPVVVEYGFVNEMVAACGVQQTWSLNGFVHDLEDQSSCMEDESRGRSSQADVSAQDYRYTLVHLLAQRHA